MMKREESERAELDRLRMENRRLHMWLSAAHAELEKHGVCLACYGSGMENSLCKCRDCDGTGRAEKDDVEPMAEDDDAFGCTVAELEDDE
jgi:hypothetical protein